MVSAWTPAYPSCFRRRRLAGRPGGRAVQGHSTACAATWTMALMWWPHRIAIGLAATASGIILGVYGAGEIGEGNGWGWPYHSGGLRPGLVGVWHR